MGRTMEALENQEESGTVSSGGGEPWLAAESVDNGAGLYALREQVYTPHTSR